jgi:hypothetical protein
MTHLVLPSRMSGITSFYVRPRPRETGLPS